MSEAAAPGFAELFGREPAAAADAPGRVNLIGEHTDYSGGYVLPVAIPQRTRAEVAPGDGRTVRAWSAEKPGEGTASYELGSEEAGRGWLDYVQGLTQALARTGHVLAGFDLRIESDVPLGGGVSSSAALEVAVLRALRALFGLALDDVALALLGRKAENELVGAPVGIMDQMASSLGDESTALFLDTRSLDYERVPLPAAAELLVIDSGIAHDHAAGEYRTRRAEVERAARLLGVPELRDVDESALPRIAALPPPLDRRARHVVTENGRVLAAVQALRRCDLPALGELLAEAHRSLRDDFEVSLPEIDLLVELAGAEPEVFGARLTGGGFGGSIVAVARRGAGRTAGERVAAAYESGTGRKAQVLVPPATGAPAAPRS